MVHALIKNNEAATIVAQAILPMLFVSIDRKYLPLIDFKTAQPIPLRAYGSINRAEVSSRVALALRWA
jgi:hypothetical protein